MAKILTPLAPNVPIVDDNKNPTPYFQRILQELTEAKINASLIDALGGDPGGDRVLVWDDSTNSLTFMTTSEVLDFIGSEAHGDILYRDSTGWSLLPAGADGDVLTTHGAGADPTWETPSGGGGGARPTIVRSGGSIGNNFNVTMAAAPSPGNFLIAFCTHWNALTGAGTGWNLVDNANGVTFDGVACSVKVASSTDTATLTPFVGGGGGGSVIIYEVSGALAVLPLNRSLVKEDTSTPFTNAMTGSRANGLILGAVFRAGSNTAFTVSTYTTDVDITGTTANNTPRRTQGIHLDTNAGTNGDISMAFTGGNFAGYLVEVVGG